MEKHLCCSDIEIVEESIEESASMEISKKETSGELQHSEPRQASDLDDFDYIEDVQPPKLN